MISNGVINLAPDKGRVFAEAARVLRPGGRLALADIVSGRELKERTRRNVELWAACIAGAIPRENYLDAIEAQGLEVAEVRAQRLPLHLRARARRLQHLRGRERLARREEAGLSGAARSRTFQAPGCDALPVLKTGWATRPLPLRAKG